MKAIRIALASVVVALALDLICWFASGNSGLFFVVFAGRWMKFF